MTIAIAANNQIVINGEFTALSLAQSRDGTIIYTPEGMSSKYAEHKMPHARYSAAHPAPASGAAGCDQLEADILALIKTL